MNRFHESLDLFAQNVHSLISLHQFDFKRGHGGINFRHGSLGIRFLVCQKSKVSLIFATKFLNLKSFAHKIYKEITRQDLLFIGSKIFSHLWPDCVKAL